MTLLKYLFAAAVLFSTSIYAEEKATETLIQAIEVDRFMVNWSPNSRELGRAIVYPCADCAPTIMTFDQNTELLIDGKNVPIEGLDNKVDWSGLITVTNQAPTKIIRIRIN